MSWQNGVFPPQGSLLFGVQKFSLYDCPKILLHLFEEDTLLFLLIVKLWLKAVYQVVILCLKFANFMSKIGKICKISKNPKKFRFPVEYENFTSKLLVKLSSFY